MERMELAPSRSLRARVARALEEGALHGPFTLGAARVHAWIASGRIARPLVLPRHAKVVTVGGATLGGSGKTRVAIACTRFFAEAGKRVALVGHAYRARASRARVVGANDEPRDVGDEALVAARALEALEASVVIGPSRQAAVDHAASLGAEIVVVDGPLTTAPVPPALAVLAVDAHEPWGAGALAPAGDLRAPRDALLRAADLVVPVDASLSPADIERLQHARFGLFTAIARPARLLAAFARAGLCPAVHVSVADHGGDGRAPRLGAYGVESWVATPKCAIELERSDVAHTTHVLEDRLPMPAALTAELARVLHEPTWVP